MSMVFPFREHRAAGFTLVELLAAIAVMGILFAMCFQIISSISQLTTGSAKEMDSLSQSRTALDRIGLDMEARVRDSQVAVLFVKRSGNDEFAFYSESNRGSSTRLSQLVAYRVASAELERAAVATSWEVSNPLLFTPGTASLPTASTYQNLADSVFRLEVLFLLRSTNQLTVTAPTSWSDVAAVVVGVVALDATSRKMVTSAQLDALAAYFPDAVNGRTLLDLWSPLLSNVHTVIPLKAAPGVRIYQRVFYVE